MKKESCSKFCNGPVVGNTGIHCEVGYKMNPLTEKATQNAIENGGRFEICERNEWKWIGKKN